MRLPRRRFLQLAAAAAVLPSAARNAAAQTFPSRPVTIVVPYPAGGPADTIGRIMADGLRASLGQPVIIENVGGASGSIGVGRVARAAPDGYTLVLGNWASNVLNGAIFALPYDLLNDFAPVARLGNEPLLIVARKAMPANDLKELMSMAEGAPGPGDAGYRRARQRLACGRRILPEGDRHPLSLRLLSRPRAGDAGPRRRPDRHGDADRGDRRAAGARRRDQGLCGHRQAAPRGRTRHPHRG